MNQYIDKKLNWSKKLVIAIDMGVGIQWFIFSSWHQHKNEKLYFERKWQLVFHS